MTARDARDVAPSWVPIMPDVRRFSPENRRKLSAPAFRTFISIADAWRLSEEQRRLVLGYPARSTFYSWCRAARELGTITLSVDRLTRISAILGIHQALSVLFSDESERRAWLTTPHDALLYGGHPPLDLVVSGTLDGLMLVRRFLEAACGGIYMPPNSVDVGFEPYRDSEIRLQ